LQKSDGRPGTGRSERGWGGFVKEEEEEAEAGLEEWA
jgi:hypothetical protein